MRHKPIEVTPHLYQLGTRSFPVYLSMGDEGMLIEGGTGPTFDIIMEQINFLGIHPDKIRTVALTHTHADHMGAVPRWRKVWPHLQVIAGPTAAKFLVKERFVDEFLPADKMIADMLIEKGDIAQAPEALEDYNFEADAVVDEGGKIDLGDDVQWQVFLTPGHSPCHINLYEAKEGNLAIGDMTGYYDPDLDLFWPNYFQSLEAYCNSIRKMMKVECNRVLLSHNGAIEGKGRDYLKKALVATQAYHKEMIERLARGDDSKRICADKADWIVSIGALATYDVLTFLAKLLLNNSDRERDKVRFEL